MENLSSTEEDAIEELRQRVKSCLEPQMIDDDSLFFRFLKARDFKMNQAEEMLRKHLAWRKINQVDRILTDYKPVEVLDKYCTYTVLGYDKEGYPVIYSPAGNADVEGVSRAATMNEFKKFFIRNLERDCLLLKKQTEKLGRPITQFVHIQDLENFTLAKATSKRNLDLMMYFTSLLQDHYPEIMKSVYMINAPIYFTMTFSILKAVMGDALIRKINIFGSNGWKEFLLQKIDADVLPAFLGGTRTDPDGNPRCSSFIASTSKIPEHYYICNSRKPLDRKSDTKKLVVPARSQIKETLLVEEPEAFIEWEYEIKSRDIGFGLFYHKGTCADQSEVIELIPTQKVYFYEGYETGRYRCQKPGTYIIVFDNSYSWVTQKELCFRAAVISSSNQKTENFE